MRPVVVDVEAGPPAGIQCLICRRVSKCGEVVFLHTIHHWGYICIHKACMKAMMDEAPLDSYENLQAKMLSGDALFD